jgi:hypothetical protein
VTEGQPQVCPVSAGWGHGFERLLSDPIARCRCGATVDTTTGVITSATGRTTDPEAHPMIPTERVTGL